MLVAILAALIYTLLQYLLEFGLGLFLTGPMASYADTIGAVCSLVIAWLILLPVIMKLFDADLRDALIFILVVIVISIPVIIAVQMAMVFLIFLILLLYIPLAP
ncbi:MAG: hypothetical protein ACFFCO_08210 [Promethearchaeota archaeon]